MFATGYRHMKKLPPQDITETLDQGGTIITANDRLARQLRLVHAERCRTDGKAVWMRPAIRSWQEWLRECHGGLLDRALTDIAERPPVVLSPRQAEAVWQRIIEQSPTGAGLLQGGATAIAAAEAWDLLCGWQVPLTGSRQDEHDDSRVFNDWLQRYLTQSGREQWLDSARLADGITAAFEQGRLQYPPILRLAGFDEQRPQQRKLFDALTRLGCDVAELGAPTCAVSVGQLPCADAAAEIRMAATWARKQLEQDPDRRIGIIVHDLASRRETIRRTFDEVLCPAYRLPGEPGARPYNISLGRPLVEMPPVRDALLALELATGPVGWARVSALLRSPFLAGVDRESDSRARLDARLRSQGREVIGLRELRYQAEAAQDCPRLQQAVARCQTLLGQISGKHTAGTWAGHFSDWLAALGWSRGRPLASAEYQAVRAWWELLAEFAMLDDYAGPLDRHGALTRLRRLATRELFQPQSTAAPIQILGLLEAAGLQFDRLWIMGLHDDVWPASPRPHPLLPIRLQCDYGMPHATAKRELEFASRVTERLLGSAREIIVSWPQRDGDTELRPSPLFDHLPLADSVPEPAADLAHWLQAQGSAVEPFIDAPPPAWSAAETLCGGTDVLRHQAACPFRAFAQHRLHAEALGEPVAGLDAAMRGALVHEVMRAIWEELRDQQTLLGLDPERCRTLVAGCVDGAIADWERRNAARLPARFRRVEAARLTGLAVEWLQLDRDRAPFAVEAREAEQILDIAGLTLRGRLDRLDRLPDGRCLIIDYKTGKVDPKTWLDDRPDEPQLPLYALGQREQLAGIAFAQVRVGDLQYAGVAADEGLAPGITSVARWKQRPPEHDDLPALLDYWQRQLSTLARAFRNGVAEVDPKDPNRTCRYCPQGTLCRIDELSLGGRDLGEESADD